MTIRRLFGFLVVGAMIVMPNAVLADTGKTTVYQTPIGSYNNSLDTSGRQTVGTNRLITTKSTIGGSTQNSADFRRSGAFHFREGYKRQTPFRDIKVKTSGPGLPGHIPSASVPELDSSLSQSAFALLIGGVFVLRSRKRRNK